MSEDAKIDQATQEAIAEHTDTVAHQPAQEATAECADAMVQQSVEQDSGEGRKTAQAEAPSAQEPAADCSGEADAPEASLDLLIRSSAFFFDLCGATGTSWESPRNPGRIDKRRPMWVPFMAELRRSGPLTIG